MTVPTLIENTPKPLYLVPQHVHTSLGSAYGALQGLAEVYPSIRFGLFRHGGKWLVFRVHEQQQQALRTAYQAQSDGGASS